VDTLIVTLARGPTPAARGPAAVERFSFRSGVDTVAVVATRLVGRADELSSLLAHCASEPPGAVLVTGEAGVGKTRLLDELADRLRGAAAVVLRGSAVEGGGPYRPLVRAVIGAAPPSLAGSPLLGPHAAVLARLLPGWPPLPPAPAPDLADPVVVLGEAVRSLLQIIDGERRSVLVLDDLDLLAYLCAGALPVPLVLAARDDERGPAELATVGRHASRQPLNPLDEAGVAVLAAERVGAPVDPEAVAYLCAASGGLPLLVADLTAGLVESGGLRREGGVWRPDGPLRSRVPGAFTRLVVGRVRGLATPVRTLVRTAALLGDDLDWRFVATATAQDDPVAALRAAVDAGLFRTGDPDALRCASGSAAVGAR
jgi:predicted ATPase